MSRYILKGELKGDFIGFDGNKGRLADVINFNKEAYELFTEYEEKLRKTLLFNLIYSDDMKSILYNITQIVLDLECNNKEDKPKYNLELSLYDIDNEERIDRCEEYLTYEVLQEIIGVLNVCKDYDLI